jgi:single-strand DNA-binding protein
MKNITIAGNIGKDADVRTTQGGDIVTGWSVAVEDRSGREKTTIWFDVSMWGKRGETLAQYLTKGSRVAVSGDLGRREYNGKTYLTVRADQVTLLGSAERREERQSYSDVASGDQAPRGGGPMGDIDDEIPFSPEWRG